MSEISRSLAFGLAAALGVTLCASVILGAAQLFLDIPDGILTAASCAVMGGAAYAAGYTATQQKRSRGLIQGALCGAGIYIFALILSIASGLCEFSDMSAIKAAVCLIFGIIGGVKGVNTKKTGERH